MQLTEEENNFSDPDYSVDEDPTNKRQRVVSSDKEESDSDEKPTRKKHKVVPNKKTTNNGDHVIGSKEAKKECTICNKMIRSSYIDRHVKTHSKDRIPCPFPNCLFTFSRGDALKYVL